MQRHRPATSRNHEHLRGSDLAPPPGSGGAGQKAGRTPRNPVYDWSPAPDGRATPRAWRSGGQALSRSAGHGSPHGRSDGATRSAPPCRRAGAGSDDAGFAARPAGSDAVIAGRWGGSSGPVSLLSHGRASDRGWRIGRKGQAMGQGGSCTALVIGAGPAGLMAAAELACTGHQPRPSPVPHANS